MFSSLKRRRFSLRDRARCPSRKGVMKLNIKVWVVVFVFCGLAVGSAFGEQKTNADETSLGAIAREFKAERAKEPKAAKVFTNDNLPNASFQSESDSMNKESNGSGEGSAKSSGSAHRRDYYRTEMSVRQLKLDTDQRELSVLEQKLGQNQTQYYADPNKTLHQEYSRGDINKLTDQIDAKKQQVADDEKSIEDLRDQLRQEGGDPSWLR